MDLKPEERVARLKRAQPTRPRSLNAEHRIPPGQYKTVKFPVLTFGATPHVDLRTWRIRILGLVEEPFEMDWEEFTGLPTKKVVTDIHCVTRWTKLDTVWEGVPFADLMHRIRPLPAATHVMQHAYGGYTTNLPVEELLADDVLLAYKLDGKPLSEEHGGPLRLVVPALYFWKSAKWLAALEFQDENKPGFWEKHGYHMHGDPWLEERFSSS